MTKVFEKMGIGFKTMPFEDLEAVKQELATGSYTLLSFETPTNPLLRITDIEEACAAAKKHDVISFVDNTFASPALQQPLAQGADIVWHSTTKYIGGHSDVVGGAIITNHEQYKEAFDFARLSMGLNPSPFETWLTHRGLKTLGVRMDRHCTNAKSIAHMLEEHPKVAKVYYPGLASHPGHATAAKQMSDFGGMVSFELKASVEETASKISQFKYFTLAESLGGIESLVNHPATMTHASIPADVRHKAGLADGLVRLSVGIEDVDDLMEDLKVVLD
jgi:cystathionine beta-lyase/cystathionine gamma-synthase